MNLRQNQLKLELLKTLDEWFQREQEALNNGVSPDYPAYRERVGYIRAIRNVADLIGDIEKDMDKGD